LADRAHATRIGDGVYRVDHDGRAELVYVAGPAGSAWAFWNGHVYRASPPVPAVRRRSARGEAAEALTAPMPATVIKVLVEPGSIVKKGDTVLVLEAMKMELPVRATSDGTVTAVHCTQGEMVQPDTPLVEIGSA
jgi:3-methylcrotonyl-CoA carboxylase alpha subunit